MSNLKNNSTLDHFDHTLLEDLENSLVYYQSLLFLNSVDL